MTDGVNLEQTIPSLFTRGEAASNDVAKTKEFFTKDRGTIALSEAVCITQRVDISDKSKKVFTEPFEAAVINLHMASLKGEGERMLAFKQFVSEFGTHYASITELGTKLSVERRC